MSWELAIMENEKKESVKNDDYEEESNQNEDNLIPTNISNKQSEGVISNEIQGIAEGNVYVNVGEDYYNPYKFSDYRSESISLLRRRRAIIRSQLVPLFIFTLPIIALVSEFTPDSLRFNLILQIANFLRIPYLIAQTMFLWLILGIAVFSYVYYSYDVPLREELRTLEQEQKKKQEQEMLTRAGRWKYLNTEYREVTRKLGRLIIFDNDTRSKIKYYKNIASPILSAGSIEQIYDVEYATSALRELELREKTEQHAQKIWQVANIFTIAFYVLLLTGLMFYVAILNPKIEDSTIPFLGIPLWVVIWGALGSLSAILYRFLNPIKDRVKFSTEFRWLIARPIIGILMSAVAYLAVQSGLILLGASQETGITGDTENNVRRISAIVSFLAGFSDNVYQGMINLLVARTFGSGNQGNEAESENQFETTIDETTLTEEK